MGWGGSCDFGLGRLLRLPRATLGALMIVGVFGNTAFLGYPVTLSLLPGEFPQAVLLDEFDCVLALYLGAAFIGGAFGPHGGDWRGAVLRFARSPLFLSVVAALLVRLLPWPPVFRPCLPLLPLAACFLSVSLTYLKARRRSSCWPWVCPCSRARSWLRPARPCCPACSS